MRPRGRTCEADMKFKRRGVACHWPREIVCMLRPSTFGRYLRLSSSRHPPNQPFVQWQEALRPRGLESKSLSIQGWITLTSSGCTSGTRGREPGLSAVCRLFTRSLPLWPSLGRSKAYRSGHGHTGGSRACGDCHGVSGDRDCQSPAATRRSEVLQDLFGDGRHKGRSPGACKPPAACELLGGIPAEKAFAVPYI